MGVTISRWEGRFDTPQEFPCATVPYTVVAVHENRINEHTLITDGKQVRSNDILPGAVQITPSGVSASGRCAVGPYVFHHLHVPDRALASMALDLELPRAELVDPRYDRLDPMMVALAGRLHCILASSERVDLLYAEELGHRLLSRLLLTYSATPYRSGRPPSLAAWRLNRVLGYIEERVPEPVDLAELADVAGYSISHFRAGFQRAMGDSPSNYVMARRVICAQTALASTKLPIALIANECGFVDQAHFTRRFKEVTGVTPGCFRADRA